MKLYELTQELSQAIELYNEAETDEQLEVIEKQLVSLNLSFKDKCVAVGKHVLNTESESEQVVAEIARLKGILDRRNKQAEWFRAYLKKAMEATETTEIDGITLKLKIKNNPPSVEIVDEKAVPEKYKKSKTVVTIDKAAIKADWKEGVGVDGAKINQGTRLDIK